MREAATCIALCPKTQPEDLGHYTSPQPWSPEWLSQANRVLLARTAAALAHEIKNPLGSMRVLVSLLRQDLASNCSADASSLTILEHIDGGINTIDKLVRRVLEVGKESPINPVPLNLAAIIKEEVSVVAPKLRHLLPRVSIKGNPFLIADVDGLHKIIANLLVNAGEATNWCGLVEIECDGTASDRIVFWVRDDGPGIPENIRDLVFEPFFSTKASGTGLGLALVLETVRQHGGQLSLEKGVAAQTNGTVVRVSLPRRVGECTG